MSRQTPDKISATELSETPVWTKQVILQNLQNSQHLELANLGISFGNQNSISHKNNTTSICSVKAYDLLSFISAYDFIKNTTKVV